MTHYRTILLGKVHGVELGLQVPPVGATVNGKPVPDILLWGNGRVVLSDDLPITLSRYIPSGYRAAVFMRSRVDGGQWEPFIAAAVALGYL